ncbi:hypothetical protein NKL07_04865 [Mesorhizobium sp. C280B]|uniref:hypothetical protein n=1 Tax=unclassified Mesorhizobium TaxID=325217 RepID=UPI0003CF6EC9|nr:hypothetical protein [Mesorhizobium sp. LSJC280B00]ESW90222.1 hypothetical protein X772_06275 [Mesorhizobium sp. LSJC280B00]
MGNLFRSFAMILLVAGMGLSAAHLGEAQAAKKVVAGAKVDAKKIKDLNGTVNLSTSDCKLLLSGTVVEVSDGRCGASGKYCKSSAGSACITEQ